MKTAFFLLHLIILFLLSPRLAAQTYRDFTYSSDGSSITITGYTGSGGVRDVLAIPDTIEGLPVKVIGASAFRNKSNLINVTVPAGVTTIGYGAFSQCTNLTSITIPDSVVTIDSQAFIFCSKLRRITIPSSVISIGDYAFYLCTGLTNVSILPGITSIGDSAFYGCTKLTAITLPSSVTTIGTLAFGRCELLKSITVDETNPAFRNEEGVLFDKNGTALIEYPAGKAGPYVIPSGVISIRRAAFAQCEGLTGVSIPASVTSIGDQAFYGCPGLTTIAIPAGVTSIGHYAFIGCTALQAIIVDEANLSFRSEEGVLFDKNGTTLIQYPPGKAGPYIIPSGVIGIKDRAFYACEKVTSISIPASVISIEDYSFYDCKNLATVTFLGDAPSFIGEEVFSSTAFGFTIHHYTDATGFTSPTWQGYRTVALERPAPPSEEQIEILSFSRDSRTFSLTIHGKAGETYRLERHHDLTTGPWEPVITLDPLSANGPATLIDPDAPPESAFYRVVSTP